MHPFSAHWCFQGVEKRCIGNKWVKIGIFLRHLLSAIQKSCGVRFTNLLTMVASKIIPLKDFFNKKKLESKCFF